MALIEKEAAIALIEQKQKKLCPVGKFSRNAVYGTDRDRFDAWDEIIDQITALPTIDPVLEAGGCRCGECKKYMQECLLCSFDADGSCTGGPDSDFYCGDSELKEAMTMAEWISVKDRLPEQRDEYLVCTEDAEVYVCDYIPSVEFWMRGDEIICFGRITHWMFKPKPPKEDAHD